MNTFNVLACGSNGNYQLGIGNDVDQNSFSNSLFMFEGRVVEKIDLKPIDIKSGGNHTLILFEDGSVYSAGSNTRGQCGHPISKDSDQIKIFQKIECGQYWKHISCGWEFSLLVDQNNDVYVCGSGPKGELGLGEGVTNTSLTIMPFCFPSNIVAIKSSIEHSILKLENGDFYGWGNCRKGQLGAQNSVQVNGKTKPRSCIWEPKYLNISISSFENFSLGRGFSLFHDEHSLQVIGNNETTLSISENIHSVQSMWSSFHIFALCDTGIAHINSIGNKRHGQHFPRNELEILDVAIGSEHGLVVSKHNQVYCWGWGEHGNCGKIQESLSQDKNSEIFDYMNLVYSGSNPISLVSCGCATTWIVTET